MWVSLWMWLCLSFVPRASSLREKLEVDKSVTMTVILVKGLEPLSL